MDVVPSTFPHESSIHPHPAQHYTPTTRKRTALKAATKVNEAVERHAAQVCIKSKMCRSKRTVAPTRELSPIPIVLTKTELVFAELKAQVAKSASQLMELTSTTEKMASKIAQQERAIEKLMATVETMMTKQAKIGEVTTASIDCLSAAFVNTTASSSANHRNQHAFVVDKLNSLATHISCLEAQIAYTGSTNVVGAHMEEEEHDPEWDDHPQDVWGDEDCDREMSEMPAGAY